MSRRTPTTVIPSPAKTALFHFPTGDKVLRKDDHQVFMRELIYVIKDATYRVQQTVPWE